MQKATDYIGSLVIENDTLQFIQTAEGRVVPKDNRWEYQYFLKDHLGNVRTTFTTRPKTETYSTSFETDSVPDGYFDYYPNNATRDNYTARTGAYSSRLSYSGDSTLIGLAKSLKVYSGDTVKATAYARMLDNSTEDINDLFIALGKGFASAFATTTFSIEGQVESFPNLVYPPSGTGDLLGKDQNDATPKLYLNLLYFDKDMNFITGDFARTSAAATTSFEELSLEVLVPMEGYLLIYVSNEENQANIAYFDDVSITHHHSPVLQADDYYPFGLTFNSYQRSYSKANNFKYNGIENVPDFGLNVNMYMFRTYDPALGRWWQTDPLYKHFESPYATVTNNPIRYVDFLGLDTLRTNSKGFNWDDVKDDDVVIGPDVLNEVTVSPESNPEKKTEKKRGGIHWTGPNMIGSGAAISGNPSHESTLPNLLSTYSNAGLLNVISSFLSGWQLAGDIYNYFSDPENKNYEEEGNDIKPKDRSVNKVKEIQELVIEESSGNSPFDTISARTRYTDINGNYYRIDSIKNNGDYIMRTMTPINQYGQKIGKSQEFKSKF